MDVLPGRDEIAVDLLGGSCAVVVTAGFVAVVGVDEVEFPANAAGLVRDTVREPWLLRLCWRLRWGLRRR